MTIQFGNSLNVSSWWSGLQSSRPTQTMCPSTCPGSLGDLVTHCSSTCHRSQNKFKTSCTWPGRSPATLPSSPWTLLPVLSQRRRYLLKLVDQNFHFAQVSRICPLIKFHKSSLTDIEPSSVFVAWCGGETKQLTKSVTTYCLLEVFFFSSRSSHIYLYCLLEIAQVFFVLFLAFSISSTTVQIFQPQPLIINLKV